MERKSYHYIDILRYFAILCVIMLHSMNPIYATLSEFATRRWWVCNFLNPICRVGVPLFLMISGFLLLSDERTENALAFYRRRIPRILIPLLSWNVIYYIYGIISENKGFSLKALFAAIINNGTHYHLWYCYTIIAIYLILPFIKKALSKCSEKEELILLLVCGFCGTIRPFLNVTTPLAIYLFDPICLGYIPFVLFGYMIGRKEFSRKSRIIIYLLGAVGYILTVCGNYFSSSESSLNYVFNMGFALPHFLLGGAVFTFAKQISVKEKLIPIIKELAASTFTIYLVHPLFENIFRRIFSSIYALTPIMLTALIFISVTAASALFAIAARRIPFIRKLLS